MYGEMLWDDNAERKGVPHTERMCSALLMFDLLDDEERLELVKRKSS